MSDIHGGHRDRLRQRFAQTGVTGFAPHEILELLLFYAVPRRDTNPLAHRLIDTFGSFDKVLEADIDSLQTVPGIGFNTAVLIKLVLASFKTYNTSQQEKKFTISGARNLEAYAASLFVGDSEERCYLMCFDASGELISTVKVSEGTVTSTDVSPRKIVELATRHKAVAVILAHNHPGGILSASAADILLTKKLCKILHDVGITLTDHVIVSGREAISLAYTGVLHSIRQELNI